MQRARLRIHLEMRSSIRVDCTTGEHLLYEGTVRIEDDDDRVPFGTPRVYRFDTTDNAAIRVDTLRLFFPQSLVDGGVSWSDGWRD